MLERLRATRNRQASPSPQLTADPANDLIRARLDFLAREYDSVRAEHLASRSTQQTVITAAIASAAAVFVGLLSVWTNIDLRIGILSFAPLFLAALWAMWFGEVVRIARTSWFLWELEQVVNAELQGPAPSVSGISLDPASALHWEGWIRGANRWDKPLRARMSYVLASLTMLGTGLVSTILAVVFSFTTPKVPVGLQVTACVAAAVWTVMFGYSIASMGQPVIRSSWEKTTKESG